MIVLTAHLIATLEVNAAVAADSERTRVAHITGDTAMVGGVERSHACDARSAYHPPSCA
jgi:hypothetical protein